MISIIIGILSFIPLIDMYFTKLIYNLPLKDFSTFFSKFIICFNLLINIILLYYISFQIIFCRYIVEILIVNLLFKQIIDRKRPRDGFFIDNIYNGLSSLTLFKDYNLFFKKTDSFPSGHVTSVFCTYLLISRLNNIVFNFCYLIILILTFYSRINIGAHYFSDCVWAILISYYSYNLLI